MSISDSDVMSHQKVDEKIYVERLIELIRKAERGEWSRLPKIIGWRMTVSEGRSVTLSIVDNKLGDVYGPPTARDSLSGGIYLIWEDNKRTSTSIDRRTLDEFEERLLEWRLSAFDEEHGPDILEPQTYPDVAMFDEKVKTLVEGDTTLFFQILQQGYKELRASGVEFVDAGVSAGAVTSYVRNSKGLDVSYASTSFGFSFYADSLYGNGYSKRRLHPDGEVERLIEDVKIMTAHLKEVGKYKPNPVGDRVILQPGVAGSFLGTYLLGNLYGSAVANGQSAFKLEDFKQGKQVMRPDMNLVLDGLRPYEFSASRLTSEGVPGGRAALVDKGKLVTPVLDLKYAGITGFPPTVTGGTFLEIDEPERISMDDLIKRVDNGLLVYSLLGMHTQDGTSGRYSVGAPKTLVIEGGELKGKVKANLTGSFFDNLMDEHTAFGWDPHEDNPAIEIVCQVTIEE
jgi:PmbA protein